MKSTLEQLYQKYLVPLAPYQDWLILAAILLLILIVLIILSRLLRRLRPIKVFTNDAGRIHVSRSALNELVSNAIQKVQSVRKPKICFYTGGGRLHLCLKVKLVQGNRLSEVTRELQETVSQALIDTFNIEKVGKIDIIVTGFRKAATFESKHFSSEKQPEPYTVPDEPVEETSFEYSDSQENEDKENKQV